MMGRSQMAFEVGRRCKRFVLTLLASPFSSVHLKFVCEPLVTTAEHSEVTVFECANIRLEISKDVFSARVSAFQEEKWQKQHIELG